MMRFKCLFYPVILCLAAVIVTWPALTTDSIIGGDHGTHVAKTEFLIKDLSKFQAPYTWTHKRYTGYPKHVHYSPAAYLPAAAIYFISFSTLSVQQAYSLSLVFLYLLYAFALFRFAKLALTDTWALLATLVTLSDLGAWQLSGYTWNMVIGVWPSTLALSYLLFAFEYLVRNDRNPGFHLRLWAGFFYGLAILTHPLMLIFTVVALAAALLSTLLDGKFFQIRKPLKDFSFKSWILPFCLAGGIAAGWLPLFLWNRASADQRGYSWLSLDRALTYLLKGALLPGTNAFWVIFGLSGMIFLLWRARGFLRFCSLLALLLILIALKDFSLLLPPAIKDTVVSNIEFPRFFILTKPLLFLLAVALLSQIFSSFRLLLSRLTSPVFFRFGKLDWVIVGASFFFFTYKFYDPFTLTRRSEMSSRFSSIFPFTKELAEIHEWLRNLPPTPNSLGRVAYKTSPGGDHILAAFANSQERPLLKMGNSPATSFRGSHREDTSSLKAANVEYLITNLPMPPEQWELTKMFTSVAAYRFKEWNPHPLSFYLYGQLKTPKYSGLRLEDNLIEFRLENKEQGLVLVHVTDYPYWTIFRNKIPIPKETSLDWDSIDKASGLNFPKPKDLSYIAFIGDAGIYEIRYQTPWIFRAAFWLSLGLIFLGILSFFLPQNKRLSLRGSLRRKASYN